MSAKKALWSGDYQPLRVRAVLASPISVQPAEPLLPFDSLLEYASMALNWPPVLRHFRREGVSRYLPRLDSKDPANFLIPVKRWGHKENPDWFWAASWGRFPEGLTLDSSHWNKRFDGADPALTHHLNFGARRGNVPVAMGRYKSYHSPLCLVCAPCIEWHCLGAADGIATLLQALRHLGGKRSQGLGEVKSWQVFPAREDLSLWRDGKPARGLPAAFFGGALPEGASRMYASIRAPYFHPSRRRLLAVPPSLESMLAE